MLRTSILLFAAMLAGCSTSTRPVTAGASQVGLRQIQTRDYGTLDREATLRSVVSTLQDLGFVIDRADYELATISGTKLQDYQIRITVTVREMEAQKLAVRANARWNDAPIEDARSYQDFFSALDKAMFLTLHEVD
ncbi:MAG: hypothetical protein AB8G16_05695 [Gammaproteobacteria bacterium]